MADLPNPAGAESFPESSARTASRIPGGPIQHYQRLENPLRNTELGREGMNAPSRISLTTRDWIFFIAACALASAVHWWLYLDGFWSISWDESGRILDAHRWLNDRFFYHRFWLPGYRVVVGTALQFHHDLFLTPRIVSYVFGMTVIISTGWLTQELFHHRPVTWIAVAYSAIFSQRLALSLSPLSSIIFISVVMVSFCLLVGWLNRDSRTWLYLSAFGFAIAGMIRYEAWFFSAILWVMLIVLVRQGKIRLTVIDFGKLALILGAFPIVWVLTSYYQDSGILAWARPVQWSFTPVEMILKNPIVEFAVINALPLNLIGLLSAIWLCRNQLRARLMAAIAGVSLIAISITLVAISTVQTGPSWRMTGLWGVLLVPFTAYTLWSLGRLFDRPAVILAVRAGSIILVFAASLIHTFNIKSDSQWAFRQSERQAGQFIEQLIKDGQDKVLIESFNFYHLNILTASRRPEAFVWNSAPRQPEAMTPHVEARTDIHWAGLSRLGIRYLVFKQDDIKRHLESSGKVMKLSEFESWSVYSLNQEPFD
jgi:hypothetical protein